MRETNASRRPLSSGPGGHTPARPSEGFIDRDGEPFYLINRVDRLEPFLMSVIGSTDVWLFIASNGALTAGRRDPDHAIFPYYTEDKVVDGRDVTGGVTLIRGPWGPDGQPATWEPGADRNDGLGARERWVAKSVMSDEVVLGEDRPDLGLSFEVSWTTSARFGLVRRCRLVCATAADVRVLDGFRNLLPAEASRQVQNELSVLLDAYKRSEIVAGLGVQSLSSRLTDRAEPSEALRATVAWRLGPPVTTWLAGSRQVSRFRETGEVTPELDVRGLRGAYLATFDAALAPGVALGWTTVADTGLDSAAVHDLALHLADPETLGAALASDVEQGRRNFRRLLAGCDAWQHTGDAKASAHHVVCAAFNAMRGGLPLDGHLIHRTHVRAFLERRHRGLPSAASFLDALPDVVSRDALVAAGAASGDPDLERLTLEFLPMTFGRRHGDPSRPWNRFEIALTDATGAPAVGYQGNWRDIFQNWEALAWSYPAFAEGMIAAFVDATTIDGYNPYRITNAGLDWEVPEPDNPWSNIGYWSDHQIVYLARLIEASRRFHPGAVERLLGRRIFTTADVPYRIAGLQESLADPNDTITFDDRADTAARTRAAEIGGDGLLLRTPAGELHRSTLADKLLLLLAAKMVNFVPDAGIWMNTQRPEWNDANNALVGRGASVVTTAQLLSYVDLVADLLGDGEAQVRPSLLDLLTDLTSTLTGATPRAGVSDETRRALMVRLGEAGERYRTRVYSGDPDEPTTLDAAAARGFLSASRSWLVATLAGSRRADGLFHSYNSLDWDDERVRIRRLPLMLEGQVAVLGSGFLTPAEAVEVLRALRASDIYRADLHTYLLYPNRDLPGFLERNTLAGTPDWASLDALLADPLHPIVVADHGGALHFAPDLANAGVLADRLQQLAGDPRYRATLPADAPRILAAYEETFHHRDFTGRSGSFFAYEGLGSVYWHMVSKLALAVRETKERAIAGDTGTATVADLTDAYADIRSGLGFAKTADEYGAFPTDPYSHNPAHAGARQPGMTGQVKEDILNRFAELGLRVERGVISVDPDRISDSEWTTEPATYRYLDVQGRDVVVDLPAGSLAFTFCQVPFVIARGGTTTEVVGEDGDVSTHAGRSLTAEDGAAILARDGRIALVRVVAD